MHVKLKSLSPCRDGMKQAAKRSQASQMYKIQWKKNIFTHIHFLVLLFGIMRIIRLWHLLDCDLWPFSVLWFEVHEDLQNCLRPVWAVGEQTQIRQRLLWSTRFSFHFRELITWQMWTKNKQSSFIIWKGLLILPTDYSEMASNNFEPTVKIKWINK